jgi:CBS domain containing-hemolysin-like protein
MDSILTIIIAIILCAFFSGMEIAFVASNRLMIELDRKQGVFGSGILKLFTNNPGQYIATMLIGNNFALVMYGLVFSGLLGPKLETYIESELLILIINTIISTALIFLPTSSLSFSASRLFFSF